MANHHSTTCDRCNREIKPGTGSLVIAPRDVYLLEPRLDICDVCKIDLKNWVGQRCTCSGRPYRDNHYPDCGAVSHA